MARNVVKMCAGRMGDLDNDDDEQRPLGMKPANVRKRYANC
jgi:hypothetical protein